MIKAKSGIREAGSFLLVCLLLCLTVTGDSARARETLMASGSGLGVTQEPVGVEVRNDLLTVKAKDMPLERVLQEIARQSGIWIRLQGALEKPVTTQFYDLPIDRGIRRLLREINFVFLYARQDVGGSARHRLVEVRIFPASSTGQWHLFGRREGGAREGLESHYGGGKQQVSLSVLISQALHGDDPEVRRKAVEALRFRRAEGVVETLIQTLDDANAGVRMSGASALADNGDERVIDPLARVLLADENVGVRERAAETLAAIGDERTIELLRTALQDHEPQVRKSVVEALGEMEPSQAVEPLALALSDSNSDVRQSAVDALGAMGGKEAIPLLERALVDSDEHVRESAADILEELLGEESKESRR